MAEDNKKINDFFKKNSEEPEELTQYIDDISKGIDPNKKTFTDKIAQFFGDLAQRVGVYYPGKKEKEITEKQSDFRRKVRIIYKRAIKKLADRFNFEAGVDILDDTSVLYRRNKVNKNILMVTNMVLILFTFIGNQNPNYLVIAGFGIIMLAINTTLIRIINEEPRTLLKQQMAMYIGSIYILFASLGVYVKLMVSARTYDSLSAFEGPVANVIAATDLSIAQAGYILIYFALVIISLYQDATLLRILFKWVLVFMTLIHIFIMYPLYNHASSLREIYQYLFMAPHNNVFIDIILRTIVLVVFYIALYSSVSIGEMMNSRRKEELIKRRDLEIDFKAVVGDVFDVINVFNSHSINQNVEDSHRVAEIASRLGNVLGLSANVCTEIYDYSVIHIDKVNELNILEYEDKEVLNERDYTKIREKTILGSVIIKRLQLNQKSEDIVRAHFEKTNDQQFTERIKRIQRSQEGQIILLAEIYDILRQQRNYKNSLNHKHAIDSLKAEFSVYFEPYILDRFMKYQMEFDAFYAKYKFRDRSK